MFTCLFITWIIMTIISCCWRTRPQPKYNPDNWK